MSRVLFGRGARGPLIADLQAALTAKGFDPKGIDGLYFGDTEAAVSAFQRANRSLVTAVVSHDDWTAVTGRPVPDLFSRCLQLTAAFEGHHYTRAAGNFDDALITWGIVGFTLRHGNLQRVIRGVRERAPHRIVEAFGTDASILLEMMSASPHRQEVWANSISDDDGRRLIEPWQTNFARFGEFPEVQEQQRAVARTAYFDPALASATEIGLRTELGMALAFDVHVQNGGFKPAVRALLPPRSAGEPERPLREAVANAVADHSKPKWRENVRRRKLAIATGNGTANGITVVLANWGLDEVDAVVA